MRPWQASSSILGFKMGVIEGGCMLWRENAWDTKPTNPPTGSCEVLGMAPWCYQSRNPGTQAKLPCSHAVLPPDVTEHPWPSLDPPHSSWHHPCARAYIPGHCPHQHKHGQLQNRRRGLPQSPCCTLHLRLDRDFEMTSRNKCGCNVMTISHEQKYN